MKIEKNLVVQFIKFSIIGFIGFAIDCIMLYVGIHIFGFGKYASAIFSFPFAVTVTWIGNRLFTFRGQSSRPVHQEWAQFFVVCGCGFILNRGAYSLSLATIPLAYQYPVLGLLVGTATGMFFNFFVSRKIVFR
jgi:putative flippase GtrA